MDCTEPSHDYGTAEVCLTCFEARVREQERARAVAAVQAITDDPEAAAWYEKFYEDPDDPEKITVMVELDRVVDAITGVAD